MRVQQVGLRRARTGMVRIVDRRANPQGKSLANRQRFLERVAAQVRGRSPTRSTERTVRDVGADEEVTIPRRRHRRAAVPHGRRRQARLILPGNQDVLPAATVCPSRRAAAAAGATRPAGRATARTPSVHPDPRGVPRLLLRGAGTARSGQAPDRQDTETAAPCGPAIRSTARRPTSTCAAPCATALARRIALRRPDRDGARRARGGDRRAGGRAATMPAASPRRAQHST